MKNLKKIKYLFQPKFLFTQAVNKFFFNYKNPKYYHSVYSFSKRYINFYQNDENGDRETNGMWRWLAEYMIEEKPNIIFDIGGYGGEYSLKILEHAPDVNLYVFEINNDTSEKMLKPALSGKGKNVRIISLGLSNESGEFPIYTNKLGATDSLYKSNIGKYIHTETKLAKVSTVDLFCKEYNIDRINFLKIDTEGNDLQVLKGAENMIKSGNVDTIVFEFSLLYTFSHTYFVDFVNFLEPFGYVIYKIMPKGLVKVFDPTQERSQHAYFVAKKD